MNKYRIRTNPWNGNITIRSRSMEVLYDLQARYEAINYDTIKDKKGNDIRIPWWNGTMVLKLRQAKGQLELRCDKLHLEDIEDRNRHYGNERGI